MEDASEAVNVFRKHKVFVIRSLNATPRFVSCIICMYTCKSNYHTK